MKIAHLTFDMRIGGTEQVIMNIVRGAPNTTVDEDDTVEHRILCIETPIGPFGKILLDEGIPIDSWHRKEGVDINLITSLHAYLKQHQIDILHCHQYTPWSYGTLAAMGLATKVIFTEHGRFYPDRSSWKRRFVNPILAHFTDHITAISHATKQALVGYEFLSEKQIQVIYNGINPVLFSDVEIASVAQLRDSLGIASDTLIIGTISRFDPIKNHPLLIQTTAQLIAKGHKVHLLVVGDGECRNAIESQIQALDLQQHITLTGYQTNPKCYLELMDIFVLPSFSEGTSMTLLEAMSLGKPCVVSNVGGNPEVVAHEQSGLVFANNDLNGCVTGIEALLTPAQRSQYKKVAYSRYQSLFTAQTMRDEFYTLYAQCRELTTW